MRIPQTGIGVVSDGTEALPVNEVFWPRSFVRNESSALDETTPGDTIAFARWFCMGLAPSGPLEVAVAVR